MKMSPLLTQEALTVETAALSICGNKRSINEDAVYEYTTVTNSGENIGLYVVCDGMGGHEVGDVASQLTIKTILGNLGGVFSEYEAAAEIEHTLPALYTIHHWIEEAVEKANAKIRQYVKEELPPNSRSGTTLTMAFVYGRSVIVANVGDSRTYAWRDGELIQITKDHSLAAELVDSGVLEAENERQHPWSHIITRAVGSEEQVDIDFFSWYVQPDDKLLLCSDGLWQAFPQQQDLAHLLGKDESAENLCWRLVAEANQRDGSDNISAVVLCLEE